MTQLRLLEAALDRAVIPTNLTSRRHPIHRWYSITSGFSPEFVRESIQADGLGPSATVVDPFAGLGTALVEASLAGLGTRKTINELPGSA